MSSQTDAWGLIQSGSINTRDTLFIEAMALGMEASHHIHDIAAGGIDDTNSQTKICEANPSSQTSKAFILSQAWFRHSFSHDVQRAKVA